MLGLGIGLIVGAILLQIINMGQGAINGLLTKEAVVKAGEELGLKVVEGDTKLLTEEEWKQLEQQAQEDVGAGEDTSKEPTKPTAPKSPNSPNNSATNDKENTPATPTKPTTTNTAVDKVKTPAAPINPTTKEIQFTIAKGDYLSDVASGLEKAGVISSADEFQKEAVKKKANYKIKIGTYSFNMGEEYSSIISKIAPGAK
ncbi:YceG-like family protein [compost metagenome]